MVQSFFNVKVMSEIIYQYTMTTEEKKEYEALKKKAKVISKLEGYAKDYIRSLISQLNSLVQYKKYDKKVWLEQYERIANQNSKKGNKRIDSLASELGFNIRNLSIEEKSEIGFFLYCEYLRSIAKKIETVKNDVKSNLRWRNNFRNGEVLALFDNPATKEGLKTSYNKHLNILKEKLASLHERLTKEENKVEIKVINEDIRKHNNAVKSLQNLYNKLSDDWELKVCALDPGVDDRLLKDIPVKNPILKALAKEEDDNSKNLLLLPQ